MGSAKTWSWRAAFGPQVHVIRCLDPSCEDFETAGAGVQWNENGFDYGLAMGREELGETHRLSLHLAF